ncbi:hypothetical protein HPB50_002542 [Hyalomma asiaticum]|uniref:Uncharacterized protein n=1 Tax=Hyalomma asiaticum TaxID=266040 RepID=A0ACB7SWV6_HYAAI|nr:hypothetical protein HPB50_002542 [Hyalomma asiaticum]
MDTMDGLLERRFQVCLTCSLQGQIAATRRGDKELRQLVWTLEQPEGDRSREDENNTKDYALKDGRFM